MPHVTSARRRSVAVLLADVVDSTAIAEHLGPERSKFLFDEITALLKAEVERFGGTVAQYTGDGVLALFGAPEAHEDDSLRAVRAARAVQDALAAYARDVSESYGIELALRIAVNTGPVVLLDGDERAEVVYNALGDTANVAARLQSHARPGGVAVGPLTARQIESHFALEPLGDLVLKGKAEPVAAYVVGPESRGARAESPLVGRDAETEALDRVFGDLLDGRGAIVSVTGEPGIGKSRLARELHRRFGNAVLFLDGAAVPYGTSIPYWPIREALRGWIGLGVADTEARTRIELKSWLAGALGDRAAPLQPLFARLLGVTLDADGEEQLRGLSPDSVQLQTFDAVCELLRALAREIPTCVVLDDLHWADDSTLALVERLFETVDDEAIVILAIYRSEREHPAWRLGEHARQRFPHRHVELQLRALEDRQSHELALSTAGADMPAEVAELLARRSGGNPFFLEEAVRDLIERGALERQNGSFVVAEHVDWEVPALVQEALQARLDRLTPDLREVVAVAAVIGHTFGTPLLERLLPAHPLPRLLADLQRLELVVEERRRPVAEYRFRHGLVREVAYGSLLDARRRELHLAVAEALEEIHTDSTHEVYGLLAHHFAEADAAEKAARYLVAAGDAARDAYANEEAIALYERAVPFLDRGADNDAARATLLKLGLTHHLARDFVRSNAAYAAAFAREPAQRSQPSRTESISVPLCLASGDLSTFVPGHGNDICGCWLAEHLFRGLVIVDDESNVLPGIAEAFEISADGRRYRFHLRGDARWSDGAPVTAGDFAFTWETIRAERLSRSQLLGPITRIDAVTERTLEVELDEPRAHALYLFATPDLFAWPRHVVEAAGADWFRETPLVSNGPFVLTEYDGHRALLKSNPTWAGPRGNVESVTVEVTTYVEGLSAWEAGRFDIGFAESDDDATTRIITAKRLGVTYVAYRAGGSALADIRVRLALAHALDRAKLLADDEFVEAATGGLIPPALPAHSHEIAPRSDLSLSRRLLAEAGFPGGHGLRPLRQLQPAFWTGGPMERVIEAWSEIGVSVEVEYAPFETFSATIADPNGAWDVFFENWGADYPDPEGALDALLTSMSGIYRDDVVIELLANARTCSDEEERRRLYRAADQRLVRDLVSVSPLSYGTDPLALRPWVDGARAGPLRIMCLLDEVNVRR